MKKLYKSMLALGAAVTLSMSCALAACGDSHTEHVDADHDGICDECGETMTAQPETAEITDGRWTSVANGSTDQGVSLKLKEDGTFYYYSAWTQNIGTWKVDEGEYTYYKIDQGNTPTETDEDKTAYTGTQQLVLTAHDGATFKGVYADGRIWNMERETRQGISYDTLMQDATYAWDEEEDEEDVIDYTLFMAKDQGRSLTVYASLTSEGIAYDGIGATAVNATYTKTVSGNTTTYSLKNNGTEYATLAVADGNYTYTPADGTAMQLYTETWTPRYTFGTKDGEAISVMFKGNDAATEAAVELNLWQDGSADVFLTEMSGTFAKHTVLSGTYETVEGILVLSFGETKVTGTMRDETGADGTIKTYADLKIELPAGDVLAEAKEVALTGEYTIPEALYTFTAETNLYGMPGSEENANPTTAQLILYDNYSVELSAPVLGGMAQIPVDSGIWSEESDGSLKIDFASIADVTALAKTENGKTTFSVEFAVEKKECVFEAMGSTQTWTVSLDQAVYVCETIPVTEVAVFTAENITVNGITGFDPATAAVKCVLTSDGNAELVLTVPVIGDLVVDSGVWTSSADALTGATLYSVTFTQGGEATAAVDWGNIPSDGSGVNTILTYDASESGVSFDSGAIGILTLKFKADMVWFFENPAA